MEILHDLDPLRLGRRTVEQRAGNAGGLQTIHNYFERAGVESEDDHLIEAVPKLFDEQRAVGGRLRFADQPAQRGDMRRIEERQAALLDRVEDRRFEAGVGAQEIADFRRVAVNLARRQEDGR